MLEFVDLVMVVLPILLPHAMSKIIQWLTNILLHEKGHDSLG
jgi:hypothetical protein